jgi:hypothetical protein
MSVDEAHSGRSSTVSCVEVKGKMDHYIRYNRRTSICETTSEMSANRGKRRCMNGLKYCKHLS